MALPGHRTIGQSLSTARFAVPLRAVAEAPARAYQPDENVAPRLPQWQGGRHATLLLAASLLRREVKSGHRSGRHGTPPCRFRGQGGLSTWPPTGLAPGKAPEGASSGTGALMWRSRPRLRAPPRSAGILPAMWRSRPRLREPPRRPTASPPPSAGVSRPSKPLTPRPRRATIAFVLPSIGI